jgi:hypothetical protein
MATAIGHARITKTQKFYWYLRFIKRAVLRLLYLKNNHNLAAMLVFLASARTSHGQDGETQVRTIPAP